MRPKLAEQRSGLRIDPWNLRPEDIKIEDIAFNLSNINRFAGAVRGMNVAYHSIIVARLVEYLGGCHAGQYAGLMHDAHEAYVGDVIQPVGVDPRMFWFRENKERCQKAIETTLPGPAKCLTLHCPWCLGRLEISTPDQVSFLLEAKDHLPSGGLNEDCATQEHLAIANEWKDSFTEIWYPPSAERSERWFMQIYQRLTRKVG